MCDEIVSLLKEANLPANEITSMLKNVSGEDMLSSIKLIVKQSSKDGFVKGGFVVGGVLLICTGAFIGITYCKNIKIKKLQQENDDLKKKNLRYIYNK